MGNTMVTYSCNNSIVTIRLEISIVISCLIKSMRDTNSIPTFITLLITTTFIFNSINDVNLTHLFFFFYLFCSFTLYIIISHNDNISLTRIVLTILCVLR